MAELTAQIELKGVDRVSPVMRRVANRFRATASSMTRHNSRLAASFAAVRKQNQGLLRGMKRLGIVTAALGGVAFVKGIKAGADFQTAMADLSAITGIAGKDLENLRETTLRFSTESILPATKVAEAFKLVASAKSELIKDPEGFQELTKQVILLSNAQGVSLPVATKVATDAMNQFGATAKDASRFVNILAAGSKIGSSDLADTGPAILKVGVIAKRSNLTFEETNSLIQVLAKNGLKGSEAGTALRVVLSRLAKSGKKEFDPAIVGINGSLENLAKANLKTTDLMKLFGEEMFSAGGILIDNRKLVADWTKQITGTNIAQEQAQIRMRTFAKQAEALGIKLRNSMIRVFLKLQPTLSRIVGRMAAFFDKLDDKKIEAFARKMEGLIESVVRLWDRMGGLEGVINKAKWALIAFASFKIIQTIGILTNSIFGVSGAFGAVKVSAGLAKAAVLGFAGSVTGPLLALSSVVGGLALGFSKMGRNAFKGHPILKTILSGLNPAAGLGFSSQPIEEFIGKKIAGPQPKLGQGLTRPPPSNVFGEGGSIQLIKKDVQGFVGRVTGLAKEVNANLAQQKKPQNINLNLKIDSPIPARVTGVSGGNNTNITANTGSILPR